VAGSVPGPVDLVAGDTSGIFDRTQFKYTSKDGTEFVINQGGGLQSLKDTNNNTLTISASGIVHSSGKSITFTRDTQGRITQMTDPNGVSNFYTYDANGDLISYKERANNTTSFTYEPLLAHHLKSIIDPLGRTPIRNDYDASGRLLKHTDANGNEISYLHNIAARIETVTDRLGHQTTFGYDNRGNVLQKTDALNNHTSFQYFKGYLQKQTDAQNNERPSPMTRDAHDAITYLAFGDFMLMSTESRFRYRHKLKAVSCFCVFKNWNHQKSRNNTKKILLFSVFCVISWFLRKATQN
jgi:YD repeat-containing protein